MEEEAGSKEGTPANRQLSARASEKGDNFLWEKNQPPCVAGGHCEEAEAEGKASSSCSSKESVPELQAGGDITRPRNGLESNIFWKESAESIPG